MGGAVGRGLASLALLALASCQPVAVDPPAICDALVNATLGGALVCLVNRTRTLQGNYRFALLGGLRLSAGVTLECSPALCALELSCATGEIELEPFATLRGGNITLIADGVSVAPGARVSASALGFDDSPNDYYGDRHAQGAGHGARAPYVSEQTLFTFVGHTGGRA
ncbi:hypothetical protein T492DRAFT_855317 [Pavlovales sp. CCMP2436]|nr:hypothetical protein T492DRAFT_855317 [Pavlovales sp. CCMP2436]